MWSGERTCNGTDECGCGCVHYYAPKRCPRSLPSMCGKTSTGCHGTAATGASAIAVWWPVGHVAWWRAIAWVGSRGAIWRIIIKFPVWCGRSGQSEWSSVSFFVNGIELVALWISWLIDWLIDSFIHRLIDWLIGRLIISQQILFCIFN